MASLHQSVDIPEVSHLSNDQYTVAWICALDIELKAALCMLDKEHGRPRDDSHAKEKNSYVCGEIYGHNVVIAVLPNDTNGTHAAQTAADSLADAFVNIGSHIFVGIAGGLPIRADGIDIRLGDVVVGTNVTHDEHGKKYPEDFRSYPSLLRRAKHQLLSAVTTLKAEIRPGHVEKRLYTGVVLPKLIKEDMAGSDDSDNADLQNEFAPPSFDQCPENLLHHQFDLDNPAHPAFSLDILFKATTEHVDGAARKFRHPCGECNMKEIILREPRTGSYLNNPRIHRGTIASGNVLVRDPKLRDDIQRRTGALCVEMEAVGLLQDFPFLVIRGICDYADSHKNDIWQPYAAINAAGYARELLRKIQKSKLVKDSSERSQSMLFSNKVKAILAQSIAQAPAVSGENYSQQPGQEPNTTRLDDRRNHSLPPETVLRAQTPSLIAPESDINPSPNSSNIAATLTSPVGYRTSVQSSSTSPDPHSVGEGGSSYSTGASSTYSNHPPQNTNAVYLRSPQDRSLEYSEVNTVGYFPPNASNYPDYLQIQDNQLQNNDGNQTANLPVTRSTQAVPLSMPMPDSEDWEDISETSSNPDSALRQASQSKGKGTSNRGNDTRLPDKGYMGPDASLAPVTSSAYSDADSDDLYASTYYDYNRPGRTGQELARRKTRRASGIYSDIYSDSQSGPSTTYGQPSRVVLGTVSDPCNCSDCSRTPTTYASEAERRREQLAGNIMIPTVDDVLITAQRIAKNPENGLLLSKLVMDTEEMLFFFASVTLEPRKNRLPVGGEMYSLQPMLSCSYDGRSSDGLVTSPAKDLLYQPMATDSDDVSILDWARAPRGQRSLRPNIITPYSDRSSPGFSAFEGIWIAHFKGDLAESTRGLGAQLATMFSFPKIRGEDCRLFDSGNGISGYLDPIHLCQTADPTHSKLLDIRLSFSFEEQPEIEVFDYATVNVILHYFWKSLFNGNIQYKSQEVTGVVSRVAQRRSRSDALYLPCELEFEGLATFSRVAMQVPRITGSTPGGHTDSWFEAWADAWDDTKVRKLEYRRSSSEAIIRSTASTTDFTAPRPKDERPGTRTGAPVTMRSKTEPVFTRLQNGAGERSTGSLPNLSNQTRYEPSSRTSYPGPSYATPDYGSSDSTETLFANATRLLLSPSRSERQFLGMDLNELGALRAAQDDSLVHIWGVASQLSTPCTSVMLSRVNQSSQNSFFRAELSIYFPEGNRSSLHRRTDSKSMRMGQPLIYSSTPVYPKSAISYIYKVNRPERYLLWTDTENYQVVLRRKSGLVTYPEDIPKSLPLDTNGLEKMLPTGLWIARLSLNELFKNDQINFKDEEDWYQSDSGINGDSEAVVLLYFPETADIPIQRYGIYSYRRVIGTAVTVIQTPDFNGILRPRGRSKGTKSSELRVKFIIDIDSYSTPDSTKLYEVHVSSNAGDANSLGYSPTPYKGYISNFEERVVPCCSDAACNRFRAVDYPTKIEAEGFGSFTKVGIQVPKVSSGSSNYLVEDLPGNVKREKSFWSKAVKKLTK